MAEIDDPWRIAWPNCRTPATPPVPDAASPLRQELLDTPSGNWARNGPNYNESATAAESRRIS